MDLREAAALHTLGMLPSDSMPEIALEALVDGYDAPRLVALAGATPYDFSYELRDLFDDALSEIGLYPMSQLEAVRLLIRMTAERVATGSIPAREGAKEIVQDLHGHAWEDAPDREYVGDGLGIARLAWLYYAHDDVALGSGQTHEEIDREIQLECRRLVDETPSETGHR